MQSDGLIQRFQLMVYPDSEPSLETDIEVDHYALAKVRAIFQKLDSADFCALGATADGARPHFRFSAEAQPVVMQWLDRNTRKVSRCDEVVMQQQLSKYRGLMPKLALIFHLIYLADGGTPGPVTISAVNMAMAWCDYLESHARRIYSAVNAAALVVSELAKRIRKGLLGEDFTVRDIYRKEWSGLKDKERVGEACEDLVKLGWLYGTDEVGLRGGRPSRRYHVNPAITGKGSRDLEDLI